MKFVYPNGATPYNQDDEAALIPKHITTQQQLNEWEQENIIAGERWLFSRKHKDLLSIFFVKKLHKKMFDKTWMWAGDFRCHNTNIGVPYPHIQENLANLFADVAYWASNNTFSLDEIAARLHARLVFVHPFSNGNGRHARLLTDAFLKYQGAQRFTWGRKTLSDQSDFRNQYIEALKKADHGDLEALVRFVRS